MVKVRFLSMPCNKHPPGKDPLDNQLSYDYTDTVPTWTRSIFGSVISLLQKLTMLLWEITKLQTLRKLPDFNADMELKELRAN